MSPGQLNAGVILASVRPEARGGVRLGDQILTNALTGKE